MAQDGSPKPEAIDQLIRQLGSDGFADREAAFKSLQSVGEPALEPLRKAALGNEDVEIRNRAKRLVELITEQKMLAGLPKLTFRSVYFPADGKPSYDRTAAYGDFSLSGPKSDSLKPLPKGMQYLAYDPTNKRYYGLAQHQVWQVDLEKGTAEKMSMGEDVPKLSWPCGIAFDTKRQRLVVASLGGVGYLYAYSPKSEKWSLITDLKNLDLAALAYDDKADCLYGLHIGSPGAVFTRFDEKGQAVKQIKLTSDAFPQGLGGAPGGIPVALTAVEGYVVIVAEAGIYVVDPLTEKVRQTAKTK